MRTDSVDTTSLTPLPIYQILINSEDQLSAFITVLPASTVITMAWFTAVRVVFTKSENV